MDEFDKIQAGSLKCCVCGIANPEGKTFANKSIDDVYIICNACRQKVL